MTEEQKEQTLFPLMVNGKITNKDVKYFAKKPWDLKSFLFSQSVTFRLRDKKLMRVAFRLWWKNVIEFYGKSKWIECIVFCRREDGRQLITKKNHSND